jgi:hypothetical protein
MLRHRKTFREPRFILQMRMRCPLDKLWRLVVQMQVQILRQATVADPNEAADARR